ncbi:alpha-ketoglutarate-dependent dioxygenase alkB 6 [Diplogelasinospora grovesii]|uniref:Alpha-ketoglutarate-dependent dioxygenase alkB 6 n=1 Tax=Diplogelasinospora grovesii TaxID=303347 RepID=A0AAN6NIL7_9PEZI|nr:alpha-ketoglutarate-dependent dioxygenase alkB 6 [Diplogelasinospora grovesii]
MDPSGAFSSPLEVKLPSSLEASRIQTLPPNAYYISDFISEEEERIILDKVEHAPKARWRQLTHRRLQTWPSDLVKNTLLDAQPLPNWLEQPVVSRLLSIPVSDDEPHIFASSPHGRPNHVLINEYPPETGIMPHKDGAAYHPVVCTVSLGSSLCLNLYKSKEDGALDPEPVWRILQEPRSLLITTGELYSDYLHGIEPISEDANLSEQTVANWHLLRSSSSFEDGRNQRQTRISLTYRDVLKVSKLGSKLGPLFKR